MIASGRQLGDYKIIRSLGRGGMAEVYEAQDLRLGRNVALKVLPTAALQAPELIPRFDKEVRAVAALSHHGIVTVFEVGHTATERFFAMRLLPGGDLRKRIREGLDPAEALGILREVAAAFAHAHARGFVHRDVKPENILFDEAGHPVLTDFGIAKALDSMTELTQTGSVVGTPRYMSPEQAAGREVDARSDLYSLGVILFEMLSGHAPYRASEPMALMHKHLTAPVPQLPRELARYQTLVDRLMAKDPNHRVDTGDELIVLIDALAPAEAAPAAAAPAAAVAKTVLKTDEDRRAREDLARRVAGQLLDDPENGALRFQLLRLYFDLDRTEDFLREARVLRNARGGLNPAHWEVVAAMGCRLAPLSSLFEDRDHRALQVEVLDYTPEPAPARGRAKKYTRIGEHSQRSRELFAALASSYSRLRTQPRFFTGLELTLVRSGERATPLVPAQRLSRHLGGARIFFKREDLGQGSHTVLSAIGQVYVAHALRRKRIVAGLRDLRSGVTLAAAAARHGLPAEFWLDREEYDRHSAAIFQLRRLGARLHPVQVTNYRNNDIREAALEQWIKDPDELYMYMGLDAGPDAINAIARDLTSVIGRECRRQVLAQVGRLPELVVTRGGENHDALGLFPAFLEDFGVTCVAVEGTETAHDPTATAAFSMVQKPARRNADAYDPFAKPLSQDQEARARGILGRVDYVSVKRELAWLWSTGRLQARYATLPGALKAHAQVAALEGTLLGLETAHAAAWACERARTMDSKSVIVLLVSEPGDTDLWEIQRLERELRPQVSQRAGAPVQAPRPEADHAGGRRDR
jgi:tryptophan synthase beta subunit/tRNA A-37 threonylcarbamoyl transferase component Bud32